MQQIWMDYQDEDVMVLSIGLENQTTAQAWKEMFGQTCPILCDPHGSVYVKFGDNYVPYNVVLDDTMTVRYTAHGFYENPIRTTIETYSDPLVKIHHTPLSNTENTTSGYVVNCEIHSGGNLIPSSLNVYWNTDGSTTFNALPLTPVGRGDYTATIPAQSAGTTVYYYIHAEADNGKVGNRPRFAPEELYSFDVLIDTNPPDIDHDPIDRWRADQWSPVIEAEVTDELALEQVQLLYSVNGGSEVIVDMTEGEDNLWTASFSGSVVTGDTIEYRIYAKDTSNAGNDIYDPVSGTYTLNVIDAVPALVLDLDGNHNSGPVIRDTLTDLGITVEYETEFPRFTQLFNSIWICMGVNPDDTDFTYEQDTNLYNYLVSQGGNIYMEGGDIWVDREWTSFTRQFALGSGGSGGAGDTGPVVGVAGTFAEAIRMNYVGDNNSMDRLRAKSGGVAVFENEDPEYVNAVMHEGDGFRTIGASFELGGLEDGTTYPNSKSYIIQTYAAFFGLIDAPPTPTPTPTPTMTPTPIYTPTPTPACDNLGVTLWMPSHDFGPGDPCSCSVTVCNPGPETYTNIPLFVILDVYGSYYFWPGFTEFDKKDIDLPPGEQVETILPEFPWPEGTGAAEGINWYAAMTNQEMTDLFGDMDVWTFGWHE